MRWLDVNTDATDMNLGKLQEMVRDREAWHAESMGSQRVRHNWATEHNKMISPTYTGRLPLIAITLHQGLS